MGRAGVGQLVQSCAEPTAIRKHSFIFMTVPSLLSGRFTLSFFIEKVRV
jgi:hypothetical protein